MEDAQGDELIWSWEELTMWIGVAWKQKQQQERLSNSEQ